MPTTSGTGRAPGKLIFVALLDMKGDLSDLLERRSAWLSPPDVRIIAEYWMPASEPQCVMVIEAPDEASVIAVSRVWQDLLEIRLLPALSADEALRLARRPRRVALARYAGRFAASAHRIVRGLNAS